ncbi:MAG: fumarylacetoacetate hydrolase family protein [Thermoplasmataceae archaeon]
MKIARVLHRNEPTVVLVENGKAYPVHSMLGMAPERVEREFYNLPSLLVDHIPREAAGDFSTMDKLIPLPDVRSIRDFYAFETHVREARKKRGLDMVPEWYKFPVFYFSNTSNLYPSGGTVPIPSYTREMDFELEIAVVIGRDGKNIQAKDAWHYVFGLTVANDWSARDIQREEMKVGLGPAKAKDFATSLGPLIVTADEILQRKQRDGKINLKMTASVNGSTYSSANLNSIFWDIEKLIEWASLESRLRVGDVIMTGTVGTGCILESGDHPWLKSGDVIILSADLIGQLENVVV